MTSIPTEPDLSLADLLGIVWRFKWLVIFCSGLGVLLAVLVGRGRPALYSAKGFFSVDGGFEETRTLNASSSNFIALQFVELMEAGAVDSLLNESDLADGRVKSVRVQFAQTPTSVIVTALGGDGDAVGKILREFPTRAMQSSLIRELYDRSQRQVKSQLEILRPALSSRPNSLKEWGSSTDRFNAVRNLAEANLKLTELTRLSELKSLFVPVGNIEGPVLIQARLRLNAILGSIVGFILGCGAAVFLSLRKPPGRS